MERAYTITEVDLKEPKENYQVHGFSHERYENAQDSMDECTWAIIVRFDDCLTLHCECREELLAIPFSRVVSFRSRQVGEDPPTVLHRPTPEQTSALGRMTRE